MGGTGQERAPATWVALLALLPFGGAAALVGRVPAVSSGEISTLALPWVPSLGVRLSFLLDGLSLLFALLVTLIGGFVLLYSSAYMAGSPRLGRFTASLMAFMASMVGLVLSDNLLVLYVFWELTTITSFLLIGFDGDRAEARRAARQGLLVTGAGGLAMLAGFILLGQAAGTYELSEILTSTRPIREHASYPAILALILLGAFTKSAQIPFHFWLPAAMAAPTPVSAYLHSATMVKAGVYLLARLAPTLGGTEAWMVVLTVVGAATAVWASIQSLRQRDLKKLLAQTTVMALGASVMFLGAAEPVGLTAAVTFVVAHAFYKAGLFMVVGIVDRQAGTRDLSRLGGLRRTMPVTATAACLSALSMAGLPPFIGFVGKELLYAGALAWAPEPTVAVTAIVLAKVMMVAAALVLAVRPFFGAALETPRPPREAPWQMWAGPVALGVAALAGGLAPDLLGDCLVLPAVGAVAGERPDLELALWHGLSTPLALSGLTLAAGLLLFVRLDPVRRLLDGMGERLPLSASRAFESGVEILVRLAGAVTGVLQHGQLRGYLRAVFVTIAAAAWGVGLATGAFDLPAALGAAEAPGATEVALALLVTAAAAAAVGARSRLLAIGALGVVGTSMALLFMLFGAPDLAITQLLVEALVVVLATLVLLRLPQERGARSGRRARGLDALVATAVGVVVALILLGVSSRPPDPTLRRFFEEASVPEGYGRNIVNVILVDFRAFDTLGEVVVLTVAALAGLGLMRRADDAPRPSTAVGTRALESVIVTQSSRLLMVLMLLFAGFMLLRGHDEPGGGFIGGLLGATAFALAALGAGATTARRALRVEPILLAAVGLALALGAAATSMFVAESFLHALWTTVAGVKLGTPLLFDAGVALVVVGMMLSFVLGLKEAR